MVEFFNFAEKSVGGKRTENRCECGVRSTWPRERSRAQDEGKGRNGGRRAEKGEEGRAQEKIKRVTAEPEWELWAESEAI